MGTRFDREAEKSLPWRLSRQVSDAFNRTLKGALDWLEQARADLSSDPEDGTPSGVRSMLAQGAALLTHIGTATLSLFGVIGQGVGKAITGLRNLTLGESADITNNDDEPVNPGEDSREEARKKGTQQQQGQAPSPAGSLATAAQSAVSTDAQATSTQAEPTQLGALPSQSTPNAAPETRTPQQQEPTV